MSNADEVEARTPAVQPRAEPPEQPRRRAHAAGAPERADGEPAEDEDVLPPPAPDPAITRGVSEPDEDAQESPAGP